MRLETLIRLVAAIIVLTIVVLTLVTVSKDIGLGGKPGGNGPRGGSSGVAGSGTMASEDSLVVIDSLRRKLKSKTLPEIVLGNPAFEKARGLLERGEYGDARVMLKEIIKRYPGAPAEREAYRVLGEMRLDDILEYRPGDGKFIYTVKPNDNYLNIADKHETGLDILMYLNGLTRLDRLQPNDKLLIMPLNLSLQIIPRLNQLFLMDSDGSVVKYYEPVVDMTVPMKRGGLETVKSSVESVRAYKGRKRVSVTRKDYRDASKKINILKPNISIISDEVNVGKSFRGIILTKPDMEELALLLRRSNTVEIRY